MKTVRSIAVGVFFTAFLAVSAFAQTATKVGVIDTTAFGDDKKGITKYVTALNGVEAEFKVAVTELNQLATNLQALQKELQGYQDAINQNKPVPIPQAELQKKAENFEKMQREYKFKEDDLKVRIDRRRQQAMAPIMEDIFKALDEFTKKNSFTMIFDIARLDSQQLVLALDPSADVTLQFIQFYNARPATAVTTPVAPK